MKKGILPIDQSRKERTMLVMTASKLKALRAELGITQETFAHQAGLKLKTYRFAEWGRNISYTTAMMILTEMNRIRSESCLGDVNLEDLGLTIV